MDNGGEIWDGNVIYVFAIIIVNIVGVYIGIGIRNGNVTGFCFSIWYMFGIYEALKIDMQA